VQFKPLTTAGLQYQLQWKEYNQPWDSDAVSTKAVSTSGASKSKVKTEAASLQPGTSYCIRLVVKDTHGTAGLPGADLIIDTEQVGCTPKTGGGCVLL
jgi:hypothetical protein